MLQQIGVASGFNHKFALKIAVSRTFGAIARGAAAKATSKREAFRIRILSYQALLFSPDLPTSGLTLPAAWRPRTACGKQRSDKMRRIAFFALV